MFIILMQLLWSSFYKVCVYLFTRCAFTFSQGLHISPNKNYQIFSWKKNFLKICKYICYFVSHSFHSPNHDCTISSYRFIYWILRSSPVSDNLMGAFFAQNSWENDCLSDTHAWMFSWIFFKFENVIELVHLTGSDVLDASLSWLPLRAWPHCSFRPEACLYCSFCMCFAMHDPLIFLLFYLTKTLTYKYTIFCSIFIYRTRYLWNWYWHHFSELI